MYKYPWEEVDKSSIAVSGDAELIGNDAPPPWKPAYRKRGKKGKKEKVEKKEKKPKAKKPDKKEKVA